MPVSTREPESLRLPPEVAAPELDEAAARRNLREQIAQLERRLAAALAASLRHVSPPCARRRAQPRLLDLGELERLRDDLADRLRAFEREAQALGARHDAARRLLERMRLEPGRHRWVRVRAEDLGEPGCQSWHVRPRLGLLGMLMGWWRVVHSSGCPLAACERRPRRSRRGRRPAPTRATGPASVSRTILNASVCAAAALIRNFTATPEIGAFAKPQRTTSNRNERGLEVLPAASVATSLARYPPGTSLPRPILPENRFALRPATLVRAKRPARTYRVQRARLPLLRVGGTHRRPTRLPGRLRSIVNRSRAASDSV